MNENEKNLPAVVDDKKTDMEVVRGEGIVITTLSEAFRMAQELHKSGMAPRSLDSPQKIVIAAQKGMEAGLTFMNAVQSIFVVGGNPGWKGDAAKALIKKKQAAESWDQGHHGDDDARHAWVESKPVGWPGKKRTEFSIKDAKRIGLLRGEDGKYEGYTKKNGWTKKTPWGRDTDVMLMWRAIGRHAKQWYSDVLMGMPLAEELRDVDYPDKSIEEPVPDTPDPLLAQLETPPEPDVTQAQEYEKEVEQVSAEPEPIRGDPQPEDNADLIEHIAIMHDKYAAAMAADPNSDNARPLPDDWRDRARDELVELDQRVARAYMEMTGEQETG